MTNLGLTVLCSLLGAYVLLLEFVVYGQQTTIITKSETIAVVSGGVAEFECQVINGTAKQVIWFFIDQNVTIATSSSIRVQNFMNKYEIYRLADGGGFWNLHIYRVDFTDAGSYQCYVDGLQDTVSVVHHLTVTDAPAKSSVQPLDMRDCCLKKKVEPCALQLCFPSNSMPSLLYDAINNYTCMENNLANVITCGQDGRNHVGCCIRSGLSGVCLDLCARWNDNNVMDFSTCIPYSQAIITCFEQGQALLPSQPTFVSAVNLGESILVTWRESLENPDLITGYRVQYRQKNYDVFNSTQILLPRTLYQIIYNLQQDTLYEFRVIALALGGASQPSYTVEIATRNVMHQDQRNKTVADCCQSHNVSDVCLQYCDASLIYTGVHADSVLKCYKELDVLYSCLVGQGNHTPCCERTWVPSFCYPLCEGRAILTWNITFCVPYMPLISACIIEGSGLLPSPPTFTHLMPGSVTSESAIVQWEPPQNYESGQYFIVAWKLYKSSSNMWNTAKVLTGNQHLIGGLMPANVYEVIVSTVNNKGSSLPEMTILFVTEGISDVIVQPFNETDCCIQKGVTAECLSMCDHAFRLSDTVLSKGLQCTLSVIPMIQCATDGRNHTDCCKREGVDANCLELCMLKPSQALDFRFLSCVIFKDSLSRCFDEGKDILPQMPEEFSVKAVDIYGIMLDWKAPSGGPNITSYLVQYSTSYTFFMSQAFTNDTYYNVQNLNPDTKYYFTVTAVNDKGQSMPTYIISEYTLPVPLNVKNSSDWLQLWHNRSECCEKSGILADCNSTCSGSEMIDIQKCAPDMNKIIACGADGRDHTSCCQKFPAFPEVCLPYCQGQSSRNIQMAFCISYIEMIYSCFTDGQGLLPTPPVNVHATSVYEDHIVIRWDTPSSNCNSTIPCLYDVMIWKDDNQPSAMEKDKSSTQEYTFMRLSPQTTYRIAVVSKNMYGLSLPSPYLIVTTLSDLLGTVSVSQYPTGVIDQGSAVQLECVGLGGQLQSVVWVRQNKILSHSNVLNILKVNETDQGQYTCNVSFSTDIPRSKSLFLKVRYKPVSIRFSDNNQLPSLTEDYTIKCEFSGFPDFVSWTKDGSALQGASKYIIKPLIMMSDQGITISELTIKNLELFDYGSYMCNASNNFGAQAIIGTLRNIYSTTLMPTQLPVNSSTPAECCRTKGVSEKCTQKICTFAVDLETVMQDWGLIECLDYINQFMTCAADGKVHSKCCINRGIQDYCLPFCSGNVPHYQNPLELTTCLGNANTILQCLQDGQKFIPSPPKNVHAIMNYDKILVLWNKSDSNADKVHTYNVFYKPDSEMERYISANSYMTSVDLPEATKGITYTIWMVAENSFGKSNISNVYQLRVTAVTPQEPLNLKGDIIEGTIISLTWEPPRSSIPVFTYRVYFTNVDPKNYTRNVTTLFTKTRLEKLSTNTQFIISVAAIGQDGQGKMSNTITLNTSNVVSFGGTSLQSGTSHSSDSHKVSLAVGVIFGLLCLIMIGIVLWIWYRKWRNSRKLTRQHEAVAFDNLQYASGSSVTVLADDTDVNNKFGYSHLSEDTDTEQHTQS